jgi:serine/threonine-protein kinase RsbT
VNAQSEIHVPILGPDDIVAARKEGRNLAEQAKFTGSDLVRIATAISELARNIVLYAGQGEIILQLVRCSSGSGITVIARDEGPGIQDIQKAVTVGYSTSGGLGAGLPGVRRLMDEFEIKSQVGKGTTIIARKWKSRQW